MGESARAHGIMFHHFHDAKHPKGQGAITANDLDRMISCFGRDRLLNAEDWMELAAKGALSPNHICLTFDDALLCQFEIAAPVLESHDLTAFWFVYSSVFEGNTEPLEIYRYFRTVAFKAVDDFYSAFLDIANLHHGDRVKRALSNFEPEDYLEDFPFYSANDRTFRYLRDEVLGSEHYNDLMRNLIARHGFDTEDIRDLLWMRDDQLQQLHSRRNVIGLHSYSHPTRMERLSPKEQELEYQRNADHVERVTGAYPIAMSHPCNSYGADTLAVLERLGIEVGFRANMAQLEDYCALEFPRDDHMNVLDRMSQL